MGWFSSNKFYKSGKNPKYSVGDRVYIWQTDKKGCSTFELRWYCHPYKVESVSKKAKGGLFNKEFLYVLLDEETSNKLLKDVYESEIEPNKQEPWKEAYKG